MAVFISYSHDDKEIATQLVNTLNIAKIEVHWDNNGLTEGELLFQRLQSRMADTDCVIALLSESSLGSNWVATELDLARSLGVKLLPVLIGIEDSRIPDKLRYTDESIPEKIRDQANMNYIKLTKDPTPKDFGQVAKSVYSLLPSIYRDSLWRTPPIEFLHLLPSAVPKARGVLFFGSLGDAIDTHGFGRCAVICPTSRDGNLDGPICSGVRRRFPEAVLSPKPVKPDKPAFIGENKNLLLISATVFSEDHEPRSRDQRNAAAAILALSQEKGCTVVCCPLLGTGPVYSYPRFQAYKSFMAGTLAYLHEHRADPELPWIVIVVPNTNKSLYLRYNVSLTGLRINQLCNNNLNLSYKDNNVLCSYGDTLRTFLYNCNEYDKNLESGYLGVRMGRGEGLLERKPNHDSINELFKYSLDTKIADTICADGDTLVAVQE